MRDQRVGANQNYFDPAHGGGAGADSKRETEDCQDRESGVAEKHSRAKSDVLQEFVRPSPDSLFARDFFRLFDSSELPERCATGLLRRHPRSYISFGQQIDIT